MRFESHTIPVALTLDEWTAAILAIAVYAHAHLGEGEAARTLQSIQARICLQVKAPHAEEMRVA